MGMPQQVKRVGLLVVGIIAVVIVARLFLIPRSLVDKDLHQAATIERELAKPIRFAGAVACRDCHQELSDLLRKGNHRNLSCESCHGPAADHANNPDAVKPPAPRDRKFCPLCHAYDPSRPTGFPQINPTTHNPVTPCFNCHNPHNPAPSKAPESCAACHGHIQRTTSVSSHALLGCTRCHVVPAGHKTAPRTALPSIPETRAFCGTCHATGAKEGNAPRVDMENHGGTYLCWQCHYPHLPEGRG
jgi:hypothetical protein